MQHEHSDVSLLVDEYATLVRDALRGASCQRRDVDWANVSSLLTSDAGWTPRGAAAVARLARQYGAFVLRNALALAIAADVEDGQLGL